MSKTVKVRIAVVVDADGKWYGLGYPSLAEIGGAYGDCVEFGQLGDVTREYWLTKELEIPEIPAAKEVEADVERS